MFRTIVFTILLCLILFAPFVYSNELYNGVISAKQIWFYGAMALLMLVAGIDLLFSKQPFTIKFNTIDIALLAFYAYYLIRAATTPYMPMLHNQRFINWTLCVVLYFIIKHITSLGHSQSLKSHSLRSHWWSFASHSSHETTTNDPTQMTINDERSSNAAPQMTSNDSHSPNDVQQLTMSGFIINFLILTALAQAIWGLLQLYGFLPSFNANFKITGTFFNPAPYALYLAVIFPLALGKVLFHNEKLRITTLKDNKTDSKFLYRFIVSFTYYLSLATVIAILLVLPATMIRAAWLGALVGALILLHYKYHFIQAIKQFLSTRTRKLVTVVVTVAIVTSLGISLYHLKKGSSVGKLFIWEVSLGKIAGKPLFGYGVGRFEAEYNNWQAEYFQNHVEKKDGNRGRVAGNVKYAFNEFLEMTSEIGLTGLLLFSLIIIIIFLEIRKLKNDSVILFNALVFPFLLIMFVSFPLYNLSLLLLFYIILTLTSANITDKKISKSFTFITGYFVAVVLFIGSVGLGKKLSSLYISYKSWNAANILFINSDYENSAKEFKKVYNVLQYNGEFLQLYGKCLSLNKNYHQALSELTKAGKIGGDYVLYDNLGMVYNDVKQYSQAEKMYIHASNMVPHKLYPHYLLAKLYLNSGDTLKAVKKAKEVMAMDAKVKNMETDGIKQEMKEIAIENSH